MALEESVRRTGDGSRTASGQRLSQDSDSQHADESHRPAGEFSKLHHYVRELRGLLLDTQA